MEQKKAKELELSFLKDSPILKSAPEYYEFYHDYISPTLNKITSKNGIHTIGLFGSWGSGKSTIIDNLKEDYKDYPVFVFDVWKYQGDPLRRTFLIQFKKFIDDENLWAENKKLDDSWLDDLYIDLTSTETSSAKESLPSNKNFLYKLKDKVTYLFQKRPIFYTSLTATIISLIGWVVGQFILSESNPFIASLLKINGIVIGISGLVAFAVIEAAKQTVQIVTKWILDDLSNDVQIQTIIKKRDHLNSPEQFESKFDELVTKVNKRTIIVFDNIDRVQGDTAIEILAAIKTFFEPKKESNVIFIIPCDSAAIIEQIKKYYGQVNNLEFDPSDYLLKIFNVVIWAPDFIPTDLEKFIIKQIEQLEDKNKLLADNDDLIRVIAQAFKSPREIKQFLNNLVASLMVASGTDVWDEISENNNNIAYFAKVLVLKQKYPDAYARLKEKWYAPEDIVPEGDKTSKLRNFMVSTSTIQVTNAEPYIYYKRSNTEKQFPASKDLLPALASNNIERSKEIIAKNLDNQELIIDFIISLYGKYQNQVDELTKIINTFLKLVKELGIEIKQTKFFNETAETIDRYAWLNYGEFNTSIVFEMFIINTKVKKLTRHVLLQRYVAALDSQELLNEKGKVKSKEILKNLVLVKDIPERLLTALKTIVDTSYTDDPEIFSIFNTVDNQKRFISKNALDKYIGQISKDNYPYVLPPLVHYKEHINTLDSGNALLSLINLIISSERTNAADHNPNKQKFYELLKELFITPESILINADTNILASITREILTSFNHVTNVNDKEYFILPLYELSKYIDATNVEVIRDINASIESFIQYADTDKLERLISIFEPDNLLDFANYYTDAFARRAVSNNGDDIENFYELLEEENKQKILNAMIDQRPDLGFSYIQNKQELPNIDETIKKLLARAQVTTPETKADLHTWVANKINSNQNTDTINFVLAHLNHLLKSDDTSSQELGYNFLINIQIINPEQKSELASELIDWLKTPGKIIDHTHRFIIKSVVHLFKAMPTDKRKEFVHLLFELLGRPDSKPANTVALESIGNLNLSFNEYEDNFQTFKTSVDAWPNREDRDDIILEMFQVLKKPVVAKKENEYWKSLKEMTSKPKEN